MTNISPIHDVFEISPRFRRSLEQRIMRLESDATQDEAALADLKDVDHIQRHHRLVAAQRSEAMRMRIFLDRSCVRPVCTINAQ